MKIHTLAARLAFACGFVLSAAALAGETTQIQVTNNGVTETIDIEDLQIGETRQLYSDTGTLVTATRTADSLVLDVAGDKTTVPLPGGGGLSDDDIAAMVSAHDGDGGKRVIRVHRVDGAGAGAGDAARVIVVDGVDGDVHAHGGGKQVIVKRTLKQDGAQP